MIVALLLVFFPINCMQDNNNLRVSEEIAEVTCACLHKKDDIALKNILTNTLDKNKAPRIRKELIGQRNLVKELLNEQCISLSQALLDTQVRDALSIWAIEELLEKYEDEKYKKRKHKIQKWLTIGCSCVLVTIPVATTILQAVLNNN